MSLDLHDAQLETKQIVGVVVDVVVTVVVVNKVHTRSDVVVGAADS